jgi:hypothetical protein
MRSDSYTVVVNGFPYMNGVSPENERLLLDEMELDGFNIVGITWDREDKIVYLQHNPIY